MKEDYLKKGNTLFEKVYDKITDACDALTEFETQMETSDFGFSEGRIRKLTEAAERFRDIAHEVEEHFAWDTNQ